MYKVYCDDICIHDGKSPSGYECHLVDPVLNLSDLASGTLKFTLLPSNVGYNALKRMTSTLKVTKDGKSIWTGRALTESEDFWKRKTVTCEGALGYLNDSLQEAHSYTNIEMLPFIRTLINNHNAKVSNNRKINLGAVTVTDKNDKHEYITRDRTTLEELQEHIFDRLDCHARIRYVNNDPIPRLDILASTVRTSSQEINFGHNLLDFTRNWDLSNLVTVIYPRGKKLESEEDDGIDKYVDVSTVNNGSKYIYRQDLVDTYGRIEKIVDFNDVEDPSILLNLGNAYLSSTQFNNMMLEVSAIDLHYLSDSISSFELLDDVRCISRPHGLDSTFPILKIDIPLDKPDQVTYTMGTAVTSSMSSRFNQNNKSIMKYLLNLPSFNNLLDVAKENAAEIMNLGTNGYITITGDDEGTNELFITNTKNYLDANKLWRFNMNGLGYSEDGGKTYSLAMTMDGTIVADFIKTGVISDGVGLNYWNLSTGEFTLAYNTAFANPSGSTVTMLDVVSYAQSASVVADKANNKKYGGDNILNGTNKRLALRSTYGLWVDCVWDGMAGGDVTTKRVVVSVSDAPNPSIIQGIAISNSPNSAAYISQRDIRVAPQQVYTLSCYAKGTGVIYLRAGKEDFGISRYLEGHGNLTSNWKRYTLTFIVGDNNSFTPEGKYAGCIDNCIDIQIGVKTTRMGYLCGFKVERGNAATDWSESSSDMTDYSAKYTDKAQEQCVAYTDNAQEECIIYTNNKGEQVKTYSEKYTDKVSKADREFTADQRRALDESFTQAKILQRLTNNYQAKGIWLKDNQLYMNADYVRTGTLDAGIIKTGILKGPSNNSTFWNLATGHFETYEMCAYNAYFEGGTFRSIGSRYDVNGGRWGMELVGGAILGRLYKTNNAGKITSAANCSLIDVANNRTANKNRYPLRLIADDYILLMSRELVSIQGSLNAKGTQYGCPGFNGGLTLRYVANVTVENGHIVVEHKTLEMGFINGICTGILGGYTTGWGVYDN